VDIEGAVDRFAVLAVAYDVNARFGLKPHRLGDRVGEAFFERCLVVGSLSRIFSKYGIMVGGRTRLPTWLTTTRRSACSYFASSLRQVRPSI
jgi:hypothetical protein